MIKIEDKPTVYFDIDDTLVMWRTPRKGDTTVNYNGTEIVVSEKHVASLKAHALRKHPVVVWSAGGADWAEGVVKALELESYVTLVISKPSWFYDDKPASSFMPENIRTYWEGDA